MARQVGGGVVFDTVVQLELAMQGSYSTVCSERLNRNAEQVTIIYITVRRQQYIKNNVKYVLPQKKKSNANASTGGRGHGVGHGGADTVVQRALSFLDPINLKP